MITCPICNHEFRQITNTHIKNHGMTMEQLKQQFPNLKLVSDENLIALKNSMSKFGLKLRGENIKLYNLSPGICICGNIISYDKRGQKYCSNKCANDDDSRKYHSQETKLKIKKSVINTLSNQGKLWSQKITNCHECGHVLIGSRSVFCNSECKKRFKQKLGYNVGTLYGKFNCLAQNKRSKPEISLFELLSKIYECEHNVILFDGWDADIIIKELNLAIHWNGAWHYQKITKRHSPLQVQTRDYIKFITFKKNNWKNIFIKDHYNQMTPEKAFQRIQDCICKNEYDITII